MVKHNTFLPTGAFLGNCHYSTSVLVAQFWGTMLELSSLLINPNRTSINFWGKCTTIETPNDWRVYETWDGLQKLKIRSDQGKHRRLRSSFAGGSWKFGWLLYCPWNGIYCFRLNRNVDFVENPMELTEMKWSAATTKMNCSPLSTSNWRKETQRGLFYVPSVRTYVLTGVGNGKEPATS